MILSMASRLLIDTWGWLTLNDAGERRHLEVVTFYRTLLAQKALIYTTTFILDETFTLFFKRLNPYQAASHAATFSLQAKGKELGKMRKTIALHGIRRILFASGDRKQQHGKGQSSSQIQRIAIGGRIVVINQRSCN
jgi:hypothetical protein